ncbi:MAG: hypothetical protein F4X80_00870 [Chloroflexi bacterium]|nr:hypothetical protein [Chloroflexota bacterium]MYE31228.1 hypothetical protein [Chloroflexota bacterium]
MMEWWGGHKRAQLREPDQWVCRTSGDDHGGCGNPLVELIAVPGEALAPLDAASDLVRRLADSPDPSRRALARCLHDAAHRPRGRRPFWFTISPDVAAAQPGPWAPCRDGADGAPCAECRALALEAMRAPPGRGADELAATMADDIRAYLLAVAGRPLPFDPGYEPLARGEVPAALRDARATAPRRAVLAAAWDRALTVASSGGAALAARPAHDQGAVAGMQALTLGVDARLALDLAAAAAGGMDPAAAVDAAERLLRRA